MTIRVWGLVSCVLSAGCVERVLLEDDVMLAEGSTTADEPFDDPSPPDLGPPPDYDLAALTPPQQVALAGETVAIAPAVRVTADGRPQAGVRVRFEPTDDYDGEVEVTRAVTDADGIATAEAWTLGPYHAAYEVVTTVDGDDDEVSFSAQTQSDFEIVLHGTQGLEGLILEQIDRAVRRWQGAIVGELPPISGNLADFAARCDATDASREIQHRGLHIYVHLEPLEDGIAGLGGPCVQRPDGSPAFGIVILDEPDLWSFAQAGFVEPLMMHELGHVLGIGTLWDRAGLVEYAAEATYVGPNAQAHFDEARRGGAYEGPSVPVESDGSHWRESVLSTELMTPTGSAYSNPLSAVTLGSMQDLGFYEVNLLAADTWMVLPALRERGEDTISLGCRVIPAPPPPPRSR